MSVLAPRDQAELVEAIRDAGATGTKIDLRGGGSRSGTGAPVPESATLDMRAFAGVADYDPAEMVLTVGAGTPLADVESPTNRTPSELKARAVIDLISGVPFLAGAAAATAATAKANIRAVK